ncbi:hypothetical protein METBISCDRAFT_24158 [Metschnikowia bicuspidata]|uniref:Uncharacterized protein n=1 Tax=Metschnikowia bicuspidata TaxID=27322 RepID=A0A4P9Z9V8_9ASCO|nr:hypothetical protein METBISCDRAFT_24158 [Metschnikowia bicuspidata]
MSQVANMLKRQMPKQKHVFSQPDQGGHLNFTFDSQQSFEDDIRNILYTAEFGEFDESIAGLGHFKDDEDIDTVINIRNKTASVSGAFAAYSLYWKRYFKGIMDPSFINYEMSRLWIEDPVRKSWESCADAICALNKRSLFVWLDSVGYQQFSCSAPEASLHLAHNILYGNVQDLLNT